MRTPVLSFQSLPETVQKFKSLSTKDLWYKNVELELGKKETQLN
jgi:hypothetical protein